MKGGVMAQDDNMNDPNNIDDQLMQDMEDRDSENLQRDFEDQNPDNE
jgi:hypothetical protein